MVIKAQMHYIVHIEARGTRCAGEQTHTIHTLRKHVCQQTSRVATVLQYCDTATPTAEDNINIDTRTAKEIDNYYYVRSTKYHVRNTITI
jgi:hypothetical protein